MKKSDLALGYTYSDIYDEDNEMIAKLGIYKLSSPEHSSLLKFIMNEEMIKDLMIIITLDWSKPWSFVSSLEKWLNTINQVFLQLYNSHANIKILLDKLSNDVKEYIQNYSESNETSYRSSSTLIKSSDQVKLPLTNGQLSTNYGIPIAVVCCKSDYQTKLKNYKDEKLDFIQLTLRTICLKYGASLFYTSTAYSYTFHYLKKYILHRTLNQSKYHLFQEKSQVVDHFTVMVLSGWDSWGKINALDSHFNCQQIYEGWEYDMESIQDRQPITSEGLQHLYQGLINDPNLKNKIQFDNSLLTPIEIICEDEQVLLERHFEVLQRSKIQQKTSTQSITGSIDIPLPSYISDDNTNNKDSNNNYNDIINVKDLMAEKVNHINNSTIPLTTSSSYHTTSTPSITKTTSSTPLSKDKASNQLLNNFFQSLLSKKPQANFHSTNNALIASIDTLQSVKK
ncbi:unnamed protein product [Cunninghamella blakesleeana]